MLADAASSPTQQTTILHSIGYGKYFRSLSEYLYSQLGDKIEMIGLEDKGTTGNFEVTTMDGTVVLHSNRAGQGRAEGSSERTSILLKIEDLLEEA